jgi:predicted HicB family RNase H-like nuclease
MAEENKTTRPDRSAFMVRCSPEELEKLKAAADADDRPLSQWARRVLLKAAAKAPKGE